MDVKLARKGVIWQNVMLCKHLLTLHQSRMVFRTYKDYHNLLSVLIIKFIGLQIYKKRQYFWNACHHSLGHVLAWHNRTSLCTKLAFMAEESKFPDISIHITVSFFTVNQSWYSVNDIFKKLPMHTFFRSNNCLYLTTKHLTTERKTETGYRPSTKPCPILMLPSHNIIGRLCKQFEKLFEQPHIWFQTSTVVECRIVSFG